MIGRRAVAVAVVGLAVAVAHAQPSAGFLAEFQAGTDAYRLGDYATARAHLERAAAIDPTLPGPPRFLAAVDAAESKWDACIEHARAAIVANPTSSEIGATRKLHDDCRAALGRPGFTGDYADGGALAITTSVAGAALTVAGLKAGASPLPPRAIALGTITVRADKAGWRSAEATVTIIPGVVTDVVLTLDEAPVGVELAPDPGVPTHGWLTIDGAADAAITIDGQAMTADDRGRYPLAPGDHTIEVRAAGSIPFRRRVRIDRGQEQRVVASRVSVADHAARQRRATIALATGGGLAIVGAALGWLALDSADQARDWAALERLRPSTVPLPDTVGFAPIHTRADIDARADRARTLGWISAGAYVAAAAAVATGIYWLSTAPGPHRLEVAPTLGDGWGVAVRGALP